MSETNLQLFPGVFRSTVGGANPGFFLHSDGRVGIGNTAPEDKPLWSSNNADRNKLNVTGHTHIDGNLNVTGHLYGDGSTLSGVAAVIGGYWDLDASNNNISYSAGNVGIGVASPGAKLHVAGTGAIIVPSGTDAQRPTPYLAGMVRFNTENTTPEMYNGTDWLKITLQASGLYTFTSHTFTNAGVTGYQGPSLLQLQNSYGTSGTTAWVGETSPAYLTMASTGVQKWTVPKNGRYTITACGAHGAVSPQMSGTPSIRGGRGVIVTGDIDLTAGTVLNIIVGQAGTGGNGHGGGGGASVVSYLGQLSVSGIIAIAGGGAGRRSSGNDNGTDASPYKYGYSSDSSGSGTSATNNNTTFAYGGGTATLGEGGRPGMPSNYGDSGAGWGGDGVIDGTPSTKAYRLNGSNGTPTGGRASPSDSGADGGFGGGGSGRGGDGGGGGGGYTGGNGGHFAGGGGSYYDNLTNSPTAVVDSGRSYTVNGSPVHGYVTITLN